jgi:hypothetical protein
MLVIRCEACNKDLARTQLANPRTQAQVTISIGKLEWAMRAHKVNEHFKENPNFALYVGEGEIDE